MKARESHRMPRKREPSADLPSRIEAFMEKFSMGAIHWTGSSWAFGIAVAVILVWAGLGPVLGFSAKWQSVIHTVTTTVTFLLVFLIQRAENKDSHATALKLNEIIAALEGASNRLIGAETMTEKELDRLKNHYEVLISKIEKEPGFNKSHTIEETHDEADERPADKVK